MKKRACLAVGVLILSAVLLCGTGESRHFQLPFSMRAAAAAVAATAVISATPLNADAIISDGTHGRAAVEFVSMIKRASSVVANVLKDDFSQLPLFGN